MEDPALEEAAALYKRLLRRRRQAARFAGWVGTEETLQQGVRDVSRALAEAERRYLEKPD